jgi:hypothetical protein
MQVAGRTAAALSSHTSTWWRMSSLQERGDVRADLLLSEENVPEVDFRIYFHVILNSKNKMI